MIKNREILEKFERDFIRNTPVDFYQSLRIVSDLHQEALSLDVFKSDLEVRKEEKIRYAKAINFSGKVV